MKHFFLINIFLIAALAFLLLITSGNSIVEHFEVTCTSQGDCLGSEWCVPKYINAPNGWCMPRVITYYNRCKNDGDCAAGRICWERKCRNRNVMDAAPPFPPGPNDPSWLVNLPNNKGFCPRGFRALNNFCPSDLPNCVFGTYYATNNYASVRDGYYCTKDDWTKTSEYLALP